MSQDSGKTGSSLSKRQQPKRRDTDPLTHANLLALDGHVASLTSQRRATGPPGKEKGFFVGPETSTTSSDASPQEIPTKGAFYAAAKTAEAEHIEDAELPLPRRASGLSSGDAERSAAETSPEQSSGDRSSRLSPITRRASPLRLDTRKKSIESLYKAELPIRVTTPSIPHTPIEPSYYGDGGTLTRTVTAGSLFASPSSPPALRRTSTISIAIPHVGRTLPNDAVERMMEELKDYRQLLGEAIRAARRFETWRRRAKSTDNTHLPRPQTDDGGVDYNMPSSFAKSVLKEVYKIPLVGEYDNFVAQKMGGLEGSYLKRLAEDDAEGSKVRLETERYGGWTYLREFCEVRSKACIQFSEDTDVGYRLNRS